jgi:hypothetical protein
VLGQDAAAEQTIAAMGTFYKDASVYNADDDNADRYPKCPVDTVGFIKKDTEKSHSGTEKSNSSGDFRMLPNGVLFH